MKKAAVDAVNAEYPFALTFGTVIEEKPLKIRISEKGKEPIELDEGLLHLANAVRDHYVWMKAHDNTEDSDSNGAGYHDQVTTKQNQDHIHVINPGDVNVAVTTSGGAGTGQNPAPVRTQTQSEKTDHDHNYHYRGGVFKAEYGLKKDEDVILFRVQGGQSYVVLDRVVPAKGREGTDDTNDSGAYNPNANGDREGYH